MTLTKTINAKVVAAVALGFALAFSFAMPAQAITQAEATAIITALGLTGSQAAVIQALVAAPAAPSSSCSFTRDLTVGATGADVMTLQKFLNANGAQIAASGAGSPGSETSYFGGLTKAAVAKFQAANGISPTAGYFGPITRAKASSMCSTTSTTPTTPAPGTGLAIAAGVQPANQIAPQGAMRVPFTRFTLTAGNDGDVVVNSVTVQKDGFGQDAAFSGIVLIDESSGKQLGVSKSFNSNHQTSVGEAVTIARGTSRSFLVAGNMAASLTSYVGEAPGVAVIAVNTSATVSGSFPIVGAHNTNNNTLSVGAITTATSNAFASNATSTGKEVGTTAYKFTGIKLTSSSAEDLRLRTITWNQTGSVSATDLANVMTVVNGTPYPTTVSADGKYYSTNLGSGVLLTKGNSVEVYVQADIVGANSANRTIIFHIDDSTDIYATGEVYGYGAPVSGGSSGTPYIFGMSVTVSGASVTSIAKANEVPAQNIAINLSNQPLGGYVVDLKGEAVTVQSSVFTIASTTGSGTGLLTNVTIVDENGTVIAGPKDPVYTSALVQTVTFTDAITYKTGRHVYTLRGKVASGIGNNGTYIVTTVPSSGWTSAKGDITGNSFSFGTGSFAMNTMTVKAGAMVIGPGSSPASQTITAGGSQVLLANFAFDATQSGEDLRFATVPARLTWVTGAATELTACAIYDGATQLTTGSNTVNPSGTSPVDNTFTLDTPVNVTKGTVKTLGLKCNVSGSATDAATYSWAPGAAAFITSFTITGAISGTSVTPTSSSGTAPTFTIGSGTLVASLDSSSPSYTITSGGSLGVTANVIRFLATNDSINLSKLGLSLTNTSSSSAADLVMASVYDGATLVGTATFNPGATVATSTFSTPVLFTKNVAKTLTVKVDLANIGIGEQATSSGHMVAVDYLNGEGSGASSGTTIFTSGSTASSGFRVFRSYPTIALETGTNALPTTGLQDGRLMRFRVTADAKGPVNITQFVLNVATTTANVTNLNIRAFTNAGYSTPVAGVSTDGSLQATAQSEIAANQNGNATTSVQTAGGTATVLTIPAGETRYFEVYSTITGDATGAAVTTRLLGNSAFPAIANVGATVNPLLSAASTVFTNTANSGRFIWSPNSTTTSAIRTDQDWTNGYGVPGLPAGGLLGSRGH